MKKHKIIIVLAAIFVLLFVGILVAFNHQKPKLLVLHSYSEEGRWEQEFNQGVIKAVASTTRPFALRWHYMTFTDTDIPNQEEWQASGQRARAVIDRWQPDVLLVVGEEAQQYVGRYYVGHNSIRIIYAMAEKPESFNYDKASNVSGVLEVLPLEPIIEFLSLTYSRPMRVRALGVNDATGVAEGEQLIKFDWGQNEFLGVTLANDLQSWQQAVKDASDADLLLVLSFAGLAQQAGSNAMVNSRELARWTVKNSIQLTFGLRERYVSNGGAIAIAPSPDGLGQQSTRLAIQALNTKTKQMPLAELGHDFTVALRPDALTRLDLKIPAIYYQAARAANTLY